MSGRRALLVAVRTLAGRPRLWPDAWAQLRAMARPGWWRRFPFLPTPDRRWLEFRLATAYGKQGHPTDEDVVAWLTWSGRLQPSPHRRTDPLGTQGPAGA